MFFNGVCFFKSVYCMLFWYLKVYLLVLSIKKIGCMFKKVIIEFLKLFRINMEYPFIFVHFSLLIILLQSR